MKQPRYPFRKRNIYFIIIGYTKGFVNVRMKS